MHNKRFITLFFSFLMLLTSSVTAYSTATEYLSDAEGTPKGEQEPTWEWDWDDGDYSAEFGIFEHVFTSYYFNANSSNEIYYTLGKDKTCDRTGTVETWCKECDKCIATFDFSVADDLPANRKVTLDSRHTDHHVFFKITLDPKLFDDTKFEGYIEVRLE